MRLFWILLVVWTLLAGAWIYTSRMSQRTSSAAREAEVAAQEASKAAAAERKPATTGTAAAPSSATSPAPSPAAAPAAPAPSPVPASEASPTPAKPVQAPEQSKDAAPSDAPNPNQISGTIANDPATAQAGVVRVSLTGADGKPLSTRAGFQMTADLVVSPAHLVDNAVSGLVTTAGGQTIPIIGTVAIDQGRDIAILRLARAVPSATVLRFAPAEAAADSEGFLLPLKGSPAVVASVLGYRTDTVQGRRVQVKAAFPSNPVGMPLVNARGELVGMVTGKDAAGAALVSSASEIVALPRGQVTPLTVTAVVKPSSNNPATPAAQPSTSPTTQAPPEVASEAKIEKKADGSLLVDDKFVVKGEGTKDKPYEVTWEMLISAQDVYDPRKGQKKLPGRIMMLDGKWVKLTGYVAFTLYVDEPKELLSMLNQWDGCCIGVPPTPYDAVEVRLADKVSKDDRLATFGVVTGKLSVKPYLAGDWLVGLYLMDDATFQAKRFGGFGS